MNTHKHRSKRIRLIRVHLCSSVAILVLSASAFAQVQPVTTQNLPAHKIHPNDLVGVSVYGEPELTRTVRVGADGTIRLPMLRDKIKADGLMPEELEQAIVVSLKTQEILVDPFVTVTVAEYNNSRLPISVVGAVRTPITFQPVEKITLLEAITRAGGLAPEAGSEILVTGPMSPPAADTPTANATPLVRRIQAKSLIETADPAANLVLEGGEEIRVPALVPSKVYVVGNVKSPGAILIPDSGISILKVMALTQGLAPYATNEAYIYRREGGANSKNEIPVDLKKIMDRKSPDVPLMANDVLYVPDAHKRRATVSVLEKVAILGGVALSAIIYMVLR
jgi:polysaccharide export outer membrane protein